MKHKITTKRITTTAVLSAMSALMFMVESLFPPLFLPGAKMGLSNAFSLFALFASGAADGFAVVFVRVIVGNMVAGNLSSMLYGLSAGLASMLVAAYLRQLVYPKISIVAVSVVSAVVHNTAQCVVYCVLSNTPQMVGYLPYLVVLGVVAGLVVGISVWIALKSISVSFFVGLKDSRGFVDE